MSWDDEYRWRKYLVVGNGPSLKTEGPKVDLDLYDYIITVNRAFWWEEERKIPASKHINFVTEDNFILRIPEAFEAWKKMHLERSPKLSHICESNRITAPKTESYKWIVSANTPGAKAYHVAWPLPNEPEAWRPELNGTWRPWTAWDGLLIVANCGILCVQHWLYQIGPERLDYIGCELDGVPKVSKYSDPLIQAWLEGRDGFLCSYDARSNVELNKYILERWPASKVADYSRGALGLPFPA